MKDIYVTVRDYDENTSDVEMSDTFDRVADKRKSSRANGYDERTNDSTNKYK